MKLYDNNTGEEVKPGDRVTTFRGEVVTVSAIYPPHRPPSTGRVCLVYPDRGPEGSLCYPSVIGCTFVEEQQIIQKTGSQHGRTNQQNRAE